VKTQALEYFDINDYGSLRDKDWKLEGAARGGAGGFSQTGPQGWLLEISALALTGVCR
jgi:hypothetical protein